MYQSTIPNAGMRQGTEQNPCPAYHLEERDNKYMKMQHDVGLESD